MAAGHMWHAMDTVGLAGGGLVALSLAPQVWKSFRTLSTADISFHWLGVYGAGIVILNVYAAFYQLWAIFVPQTIELVFIFVLAGLKVYVEVLGARGGGGAESKEGEEVAAGDALPACCCICIGALEDGKVTELKLREGEPKSGSGSVER